MLNIREKKPKIFSTFLGYLQPFYIVGQDKKYNNDLQSIEVR